MSDDIVPKTSTEMVQMLVEAARTRFISDILTAARQRQLTRNDIEVIERRILAQLDEARAAEHEFPFDVHAATDRAKVLAKEFMRVVRPAEWR